MSLGMSFGVYLDVLCLYLFTINSERPGESLLVGPLFFCPHLFLSLEPFVGWLPQPIAQSFLRASGE